MWYVVRTETGKEEVTAEFVRSCVDPGAYERCFCPKREYLKKIQGQWILKKGALFPGYFFIVSQQPERLFFDLKEVPRMTRILGENTHHFIPLYPEEVCFYERLFDASGGEKIGVSEVAVEENGQIRCVKGALKMLEQEIIRINVRKRYAIVRAFLLGSERTMLLGLRLWKDEI